MASINLSVYPYKSELSDLPHVISVFASLKFEIVINSITLVNNN